MNKHYLDVAMALKYFMDVLLRINKATLAQNYRLPQSVWQTVKSLGLTAQKSTRRGTKGGIRLARKVTPLVNYASVIAPWPISSPRSINLFIE